MSSAVETRIVSIKFENGKFKAGVDSTLDSLNKLNKGIESKGMAKGVNAFGKGSDAALASVADGVDKISSKFSVLGAIGFTVIQNLTNKFLGLGGKMLHAITGPLIEGGKTRALNIEQAKFQFKGLGIDVEKAMADSLYAVKGTAFGLDSAAKAASQFGASGIKTGKDLRGALRGIAGVAAISGSSFDDIADVFTKVAGQGRLMGDDLNRLAARGVNAAATIGKSLGKTEAEVRDMVSKGKISFKQFADIMGKAFGNQATKASDTYTGALANMNAAFSRIGAQFQTFKFESLRRIFNALTPVIDNVATALKPMINMLGARMLRNADGLAGFLKKLKFDKVIAGVLQLTKALSNIYKFIGQVLTPLKEAFSNIFPPKAGAGFLSFATKFANLTEKFKIGIITTNKLRRIFEGVFALFGIGKLIVLGIFTAFGKLLGATKGSGNGILNFAARVGDLIVAFHKLLLDGDVVHNLFRIIGNVLAVPIRLAKVLGQVIAHIFSKFSFGDADSATSSMDGVARVMEHLAALSENIGDFFSRMAAKIKPGIDAVARMFSKIGHAITDQLNSKNFDKTIKLLQTGLLGSIFLLLEKFKFGPRGGAIAKVRLSITNLNLTMKQMQAQLKAKTLLQIATAMIILAGALAIMALIDPKRLAAALAAMAVGFAQLIVSMNLLTKITSSAGFLKLPLMAASLILLATAMVVLGAAVKIFSMMSWQELLKGLAAVVILLGALSLAVKVMSANSAGMIQVGIGITGIALGMLLLGSAVKIFASMSWDQMLKGLAGVGIALAGIAIVMRAMPKGMVGQAAAILILSVALNALYLAVREFSSFSYKEMIKGLLGVAGGIAGIALAMKLMPKKMLLQSFALIAIGVALQLIALAVSSFAKMGWETLARGLVGLGAALGILALGTKLMTGSLAGAAALFVVGAALRLFVPMLERLGKMSIKTIIVGLLALAASFGVIGLSALVLSPLIPVMFALGVAMGVLSLAMLAFGAGAALLGTGLAAIAGAGGASIAVLIKAFEGFIGLLPKITAILIKILGQILEAIPQLVPKLVIAIGAIVTAILKVLVDNAPKIIRAGFALLIGLLKGIKDNIKEVTYTVADIITRFLKALADKMPMIIEAGFKLIVSFLNGLADGIDKHLPEILTAVVKIGWAIVKGIAKGIWDLLGWLLSKVGEFFKWILNSILDFFGINSPSRVFAEMGGNLIKGLWEGIKNLGSWLWGLVTGFFKNVLGWIGDALKGIVNFGKKILGWLWDGIKAAGGFFKDLIGGFFSGIWNGIKGIGKAAANFGRGLVVSAGQGLRAAGHILSSAFNAVTNNAISGKGQWARDKAVSIGQAIAEGMRQGIQERTNVAVAAVTNLVAATINAAHGGLKMRSPSKVFARMGKFSVLGLVQGFKDETPSAVSAVRRTIDMLVNAYDAGEFGDIQPVITPVLDLTQVQKDSGQIASMMATAPINPSLSSDQASTISVARAAEAAAQAAAATPSDTPAPASVKIEQNNYSPKALSTVDIYRQTNNALSLAKKSLGVPE